MRVSERPSGNLLTSQVRQSIKLAHYISSRVTKKKAWMSWTFGHTAPVATLDISACSRCERDSQPQPGQLLAEPLRMLHTYCKWMRKRSVVGLFRTLKQSLVASWNNSFSSGSTASASVIGRGSFVIWIRCGNLPVERTLPWTKHD